MSLKLDYKALKKYRLTVFTVFVFCMMASFGFFAMRGMQKTSAASTAGFSAGNIISDAVMSNYNSMSVSDIQNFLTSKNPCNDYDYNKYLRLKAAYPNNSWHFENGHFICLSEERFGDGEVIGSGQTAAEIIHQAAQDYKINPQVLLVLLQKEQGLITDTYPNQVQYRAATGFGCPDTAACSTKYYGFKNQVRNAASMFREVLNGGWSNYPAYKTVYVQYNPNPGCGGTNVYIENRATSALYRYTPYQPNASALNAGYGTGDVCGAYGNRNFYLYFMDWFGSTQVSVDGVVADIPEGVYSFAPISNIKARLGVQGKNVQLTDSDQWSVKRESDGYYTLTHLGSGEVLDVDNASMEQGTNIQTWFSNSTCAQKWKIFRTSGGGLTFESACMPGMVIDMSNASSSVGTNIQLWLTNNTNAQKFQLYTGQTVADGYYTIRSMKDNGRSIDVSGGKNQNKDNIQLWFSNNTEAQKWHVEYLANTDSYSIRNAATGRAIDLDNASVRTGANIQLYDYNGTCAQRWKFIPNNDGSYTIASACAVDYTIDLSGGIPSDGANIQLWFSNNTEAQHWKFVQWEQAIPDGVYTIHSGLQSGQVLDVASAQDRNGANIQLWFSNNTEAQKWQITYNRATDSYAIRNVMSGKALDLVNSSTYSGNNIQLYDHNPQVCAQDWKLTLRTADYYSLSSACNTGYAIDSQNGDSYSGNNIQLWFDNGTNAQIWQFVPSH